MWRGGGGGMGSLGSRGERRGGGGGGRQRPAAPFQLGRRGKGFGNGGDSGSSICAYVGVIAAVRLLPPVRQITALLKIKK
jgi:hypothetical protein